MNMTSLTLPAKTSELQHLLYGSIRATVNGNYWLGTEDQDGRVVNLHIMEVISPLGDAPVDTKYSTLVGEVIETLGMEENREAVDEILVDYFGVQPSTSSVNVITPISKD